MEQLTKPEKENNQLVVNVKLTNTNVKILHEALVVYLRTTKHPEEFSSAEAEKLRVDIHELKKLMNPS